MCSKHLQNQRPERNGSIALLLFSPVSKHLPCYNGSASAREGAGGLLSLSAPFISNAFGKVPKAKGLSWVCLIGVSKLRNELIF